MAVKRKPRFRTSDHHDAEVRPDSAGRDVEAMKSMRQLWRLVVLDAFLVEDRDRRLTTTEELEVFLDRCEALEGTMFLQSCDRVAQALNESVFHGKWVGGFNVTFGDNASNGEELFGLVAATLKSRAFVAPPIWELLRIAARVAGSDPVKFIRLVYQVVAFPLRITLETVDFDYGKLMSINETREGFTPSSLLKRIARRVVNDEFVEDVIKYFVPHHGPGSVVYESGRSKRMTVWEKDQVLDLTLLYRLCLEAGFPCPSLLQERMDEPPFDNKVVDARREPFPSKCTDVPKNWKKRRLIAIEDVTLMYFSKGVQRGLYKAFENHRFLRNIINLRDANGNAELARMASHHMWRSHATVDLSSASDSVGFKFVMELFQHSPRLCAILALARPRELDVPGYGVVKNNIFATMGNACCFPILTLVVTLVLLEACFLSKVRCASLKVYGDDAVCPEQAVHKFIELLRNYGFDVNAEKTFFGANVPFRESCGGEYLDGYDITPLRISRRFETLRLGRGFAHASELITLANGCYARRFMRAYRHLSRIISTIGYIPLSTQGSIGLRHDDPKSCMASYQTASLPGDPSRWYQVHWLFMKEDSFRKRGFVGLMEWLWLKRDLSGDDETDFVLLGEEGWFRKELPRLSGDNPYCREGCKDYPAWYTRGLGKTFERVNKPLLMEFLRTLDVSHATPCRAQRQFRRVHCLYNASEQVIVKVALLYEKGEEPVPLPIPINHWEFWLTPDEPYQPAFP